MKRIVYLVIALSIFLNSCNGQSQKTAKGITDSLNMPKTNIKVNKEYDKNGNLIRFDSTYTQYFSGINGNKALGDSIFNNFKKYFNSQYFFSQDPFFKDLFFQDSLLKYDFYKDDFFINRFKNNIGSMDEIFRQMDSIKNQFFKQQIPASAQKKRGTKI